MQKPEPVPEVFSRTLLPENARAVHAYQIQLQEAQGLHDKTIKAKLRHILRFVRLLDRTRFSDLTPEVIQSYKRTLVLSDDAGDEQPSDEEAIRRLRLKHVRLVRREAFQDAREINTKGSKTMTTFRFPVGEDIEAIVTDWVQERIAVRPVSHRKLTIAGKSQI